ncbi:hypothetical protein GCM10028778_16820 [Barrientosiimonas marina]|uniref:DUF3224 domain-containing protein n=1 Tax=Lentibacillus kimchii TaxID=1542911 RepID=A0ABW2UW77_9BACI
MSTASVYLGDTGSSEEYWSDATDDLNADGLSGPTCTRSFHVSNSTLMHYGTTSTGISGLFKKYAPRLLGYFGASGMVSGIAGGLNHLSGNSGYELKVTFQHGTTEVFDGFTWVEHTGYHIVSQSITVY